MDQCGWKFNVPSSFYNVCRSFGDRNCFFEPVGRFFDETVLEFNVTTSCDYLDPALAWCGVKDSGRGVSLSKFGLFF